MQPRSTSQLLFALLFCCALAIGVTGQRNAPSTKPTPTPIKESMTSTPPDVSYTVSMSKPWTHLLEVEMRIHWDQMPQQVQLKMPVWTPGSYLIREYERHLQEFGAKDASGGDLVWQKTSKNTWQVDTKGAKEIVASYKIYSNELTVRTNELNDEHAFWNNAATLLFVKDQLKAPSTVKVAPYGKWRVATGLAAVEGQANTFRAPNYDVLYDSPFEVSDFRDITFTVEGKPHRIVMSGEGNYDLQKCAADVAKIVEEAYKIFGEFGYDNYTFIVNLRGGGGLEHLNSTALQFSRFGFQPASRYRGFLGLVAHEYFHNYNVKRIRPDALGPFDYENENYTKLLWVAEGGTEYYSNILLRRAGFITDKEYFAGIATGIRQLEDRPGRFEQSVEEASFDAWIKYYRPDENSVNNQISYYDKGELVNMLLDVAIRTSSNGARSLDDVMRYLYTEYFKKERNYTPADYQKICEMMAGKSLDDFFSKYVRGRAEVDWNSIVQGIGLQLRKTAGPNKAYLGADLVDTDGRITIRSLAAETPAYKDGLNANDQILAIDGYKVTTLPFLNSYLDERKPNDKVKITFYRFDRLREIEVTLGANPRRDYSFTPVAGATEDQKRLYRGYMNADLQ